MSSSTRIRFLLDENVRKELAAFLSKRKVDFTLATKRAPDNAHARASLAEERAVVTNDHDFMYMCQGDVFGVVLLLLPQNDPNLLLKRFGEMLDECSSTKTMLYFSHPRDGEQNRSQYDFRRARCRKPQRLRLAHRKPLSHLPRADWRRSPSPHSARQGKTLP